MHKRRVFISSVQVMQFRDRLEIWNPGHLPYGLTVEMLRGHHKSIPANPLLARLMYLYGSIEQVGTGTEMIVNQCINKGLEKPVFVQDADFSAILYRPDFEQESGNITENEIEKSREKILNLIKNNSFITQNEMVELTGLSIKGIEKNIRLLKKEGLLDRVGPDKGGYWKIIEKQ